MPRFAEPAEQGSGSNAPPGRLPPPVDFEWEVPADYNWEVCTQENYAAPIGDPVTGPLAEVRGLTDESYHGHYNEDRTRFQDNLILKLLAESKGHSRKSPVLLFTAGAMGVGKSFVLRWLSERGILPLDEFVLIDPDRLAQHLPEWEGHFRRKPTGASLMTRLEAGLLTELGLVTALQQRRNILVDSSLRHGAWYARLLQRLREEVPDVRIVLMYVHTSEDKIHERAAERGLTGRAVSSAEVHDSLQKMPRAVGRLLPFVDFFTQVANDGEGPRVTSVCKKPSSLEDEDQDEDDGETCMVLDPELEECLDICDLGWGDVKKVLSSARGGEPADPLPRPPRILPTNSNTEPQPLAQLLRTMLFAAVKHRHQTRKDPLKTPYINHPLAVARILAEVGIRDLPTLQAALLHDTLEDTATTPTELSSSFGTEVADLVASLTDDDNLRPTTRKLAQLRGAKSLQFKAKLVRIADKLHNVWDIKSHGIPGWTPERENKYFAWACELVKSLEGTHQGLEERFHNEVKLPPGFRLGDWERNAAEHVKSTSGWLDYTSTIGDLPSDPSGDDMSSEQLQEHKDVLSLLCAAEFLARCCCLLPRTHLHDGEVPGPLSEMADDDDDGVTGENDELRRMRREPGILRGLHVALDLAQLDIRDPATLEAVLVRGAVLTGVLGDDAGHIHEQVLDRFGEEVADIVHSLLNFAPGDDLHSEEESSAALRAAKDLPFKARLILLAEHLWGLRDLQVSGLRNQDDVKTFQRSVRRASETRRLLSGTHAKLEEGLDEVLGGQVRLVSGELVPVLGELQPMMAANSA